jgi:hypothetical protein
MSSKSIIFNRTDNAAFSRIAKGSANRFFAVRLTAQEGAPCVNASRSWAFYFGGGLSGNPGIGRLLRNAKSDPPAIADA